MKKVEAQQKRELAEAAKVSHSTLCFKEDIDNGVKL